MTQPVAVAWTAPHTTLNLPTHAAPAPPWCPPPILDETLFFRVGQRQGLADAAHRVLQKAAQVVPEQPGPRHGSPSTGPVLPHAAIFRRLAQRSSWLRPQRAVCVTLSRASRKRPIDQLSKRQDQLQHDAGQALPENEGRLQGHPPNLQGRTGAEPRGPVQGPVKAHWAEIVLPCPSS